MGRSEYQRQRQRRIRWTLGARARNLEWALRPCALNFASRLVWLLVLPASIYIACSVLHLRLLRFTGSGDAFHTPDFRCRLALEEASNGGARPTHPFPGCIAIGCDACAHVTPLSLPAAVVALNRRMLSANAGITRTHSFGSGWRMWPLNSKPVFYWQNGSVGRPGTSAKIFMGGNPFVWSATALPSPAPSRTCSTPARAMAPARVLCHGGQRPGPAPSYLLARTSSQSQLLPC